MEINLNPNGELTLTIPGRTSEARPHNVILPISVEGVRVLHQILQADRRERLAGNAPRFATPASPTQEMVRKYLQTHAPKVEVRTVARKAMKVELDLSSLELDF